MFIWSNLSFYPPAGWCWSHCASAPVWCYLLRPPGLGIPASQDSYLLYQCQWRWYKFRNSLKRPKSLCVFSNITLMTLIPRKWDRLWPPRRCPFWWQLEQQHSYLRSSQQKLETQLTSETYSNIAVSNATCANKIQICYWYMDLCVVIRYLGIFICKIRLVFKVNVSKPNVSKCLTQ